MRGKDCRISGGNCESGITPAYAGKSRTEESGTIET